MLGDTNGMKPKRENPLLSPRAFALTIWKFARSSCVALWLTFGIEPLLVEQPSADVSSSTQPARCFMVIPLASIGFDRLAAQEVFYCNPLPNNAPRLYGSASRPESLAARNPPYNPSFGRDIRREGSVFVHSRSAGWAARGSERASPHGVMSVECCDSESS